MTPAELYTVLDAAMTAARAVPRRKCPLWRRGRVVCLASEQPHIRVGRQIWTAARAEGGRYVFTYDQARQIRAALDTQARAGFPTDGLTSELTQ